MKQRSFDDFSQLFNLLFASSDIRVSHIGLILNLHHCDGRIDLRRQWNMDLILVSINTDAHAFLNICWSDRICKIDDELRELLHVNDVLGIVCISIDDFGASSNLKRLFILKSLLVSSEIPERWRSKSSIALLDASQLVNLLDCLLDIILDDFDAFMVLALAISLQQLNVSLIEICNNKDESF